MKSEPDAFSIDQLAAMGRSPWDGVRNFMARNHMDTMKLGDRVLFYHSSCNPPGVVGIAAVSRESHPDPTAFDPASKYYDPGSSRDQPRWRMVEVAFVAKLPRMVTLETIRDTPELSDMVLVRAGRLSVQPITRAHFERIVAMGGGSSDARELTRS
ncbi:MAG: EVE domain-containing protein [Deltaproteobacteria bacterium]|nr:EVE domain-containing protein [Deltaproteobacteria bacterium]